MHFRVAPEIWQKWYPADWISESFPGQFRNWFYSLLAQSTVLSEEAPFRNLFGYAILLAEDGREMHKSWGNAIEFNEAADNMGADTMRWLFSSTKPEQNLLFGYTKGDETRRRFPIPSWNVYSFFVSYARLDNWQPSDQTAVSENKAHAQLDSWIVERLNETALAVRTELDRYDAERATMHLESFLDDLSNWYVRRSRRRFWKSEADADKSAAYATLYHVLVQYIKLLAPFIPFSTEAMYQNLVRGVDAAAPTSLHHCLYPAVDVEDLDQRLLSKMRLAITTASLGRAARGSADIKLRQPLARARVNVGSQQERDDLLELAEVLAEEINVKEIEVVSEVGQLVDYKLMPNNRVLGPRLGRLFPKVRAALLALDAAEAARILQSGKQLTVQVDGQTFALSGEDVLVQTESRGGLAVASDKGVTVAVDTELSPELIQEGYARDLVRTINNMRKDAGLDIADRINMVYQADGDVATALITFDDYIRQETLAVTLEAGSLPTPLAQLTVDIGNQEVFLAFTKA
jgi:isoleucyl-tRNA synthetase